MLKLLSGLAILILLTVCAGAATFYVNVSNTVPVAPYTNWPTAATNIQNAVDVSTNGDLILVSNGVYKTGGRIVYGSMSNRVAVTKAVTVQSVNGSGVAFIQGFQVSGTTNGNAAVRCVYLTNGATLIGFTLTSGATRQLGDLTHEQFGGGVWCEGTNAFVFNCSITHNAAYNYGGGAYSGTLSNCLVTANSGYWAGGTCSNVLVNCTLTGNFAGTGGGVALGIFLDGCLISNNSAVYSGGGATYTTLQNCSLVGNSVLNNTGPGGGGAIYSALTGCVLSNNTAIYQAENGGGANSSTLTNCTLIGNQASSKGGGAYQCPMVNCVLIGNAAVNGGGSQGQIIQSCLYFRNTASGSGGATAGGVLFDCTIVSNTASSMGGGVSGGVGGARLTNCIVYFNSAPDGQNWDTNCKVGYSCTTPLPTTNGFANFTNTPLFKNLAGGDLHLQSNSPCINAGANFYVTGTNDLDGNPRIVGGTVDIGAYEHQTPSSILSYAWAQQYGLPTDSSADYLDLDGTGMKNWQKSIAGLNPTNPASVLAMLPPVVTNSAAGVAVSWQSVNTRIYYLQRATNLTAPPGLSSIQSNIVGQAGTTSYTDATATNGGPYFYRVGVQ